MALTRNKDNTCAHIRCVDIFLWTQLPSHIHLSMNMNCYIRNSMNVKGCVIAVRNWNVWYKPGTTCFAPTSRVFSGLWERNRFSATMSWTIGAVASVSISHLIFSWSLSSSSTFLTLKVWFEWKKSTKQLRITWLNLSLLWWVTKVTTIKTR